MPAFQYTAWSLLMHNPLITVQLARWDLLQSYALSFVSLFMCPWPYLNFLCDYVHWNILNVFPSQLRAWLTIWAEIIFELSRLLSVGEASDSILGTPLLNS